MQLTTRRAMQGRGGEKQVRLQMALQQEKMSLYRPMPELGHSVLSFR